MNGKSEKRQWHKGVLGMSKTSSSVSSLPSGGTWKLADVQVHFKAALEKTP